MPGTRRFRIRYRLGNRPHSIEVNSFSGALTPDQARFYIRSRHADSNPADITDIRIEHS